MSPVKKVLVIILPTLLLLFLAAWMVLYLFSSGAGAVYFVRVDNALVEENPGGRNGVIDFTGGMEYLYTLTGCAPSGETRPLTFGADRRLRQGAYLRLSVMPLRGVTSWQEVAWEALPAPVRDFFTTQTS